MSRAQRPPPVPVAPAYPDAPAALTTSLASWFAVARRSLPWRDGDGGARDPYRVWLSEVMLQQTQVSRVVEYFTRFVSRFPRVEDLAAADEDAVLSLWSGLGYYSRGRNLHKAARVVVDEHAGVFPSTSTILRTLPGVGDYTAAAIATFSTGERTAVVDGNVLRVLSRLLDANDPIDQPAGKAKLAAAAQGLVDVAVDAAVQNEAIMELGALVCTPKSPSCAACPWRLSCRARERGTVEQRPVKAKKQARKAVRIAAVVVVVDGGIWLEKRASAGLFGGLWEPVNVEVDDVDDVEIAWTSLLIERGLAVPSTWPSAIVVERTLTHRELRFEIAVVSTSTLPTPPIGVRGAVFAGSAIDDVGMASAARAVLEAARAPKLL
ncbi:MAG TPA: A/G-specific adenine glycosylase [Myxococcota bacterium]